MLSSASRTRTIFQRARFADSNHIFSASASRDSVSLRGALENDVEDARLKFLTIHLALFDCDRILDAIHRIVLVWIALEMDFSHEWLIARAHRDEMKMSAAPEITIGIGPVRNRANTLELVHARL